MLLKKPLSAKGVIFLDQTQLENENKVLKEKVEKLSKDLANFLARTKNLDKLIGVLKSFYDGTSLCFNKNPNKVFQKPNKVRKGERKYSNYNN